MSGVSIEGVSKRFGPVRALEGVSLAVQAGEFLTILGPSGSGKSTLLRLIAGLAAPDAGRICLGERVVAGKGLWVPPQARGLGMVFQHYALWPHMTAWENVAFPLESVGVPRREVFQRVQAALDLVELGALAQKRPAQMSGGEQQRVALARALVGRPALLLLDECLSNLDARLREKMAGELRRIHDATGITTLYVTHDQHEALALSDRIAVLHQGRLQQVGTPEALYLRPTNPLVAASLGAVNLLRPQAARALGFALPILDHGDDGIILGVRPEHVRLCPLANASAPAHTVRGRVLQASFLGEVRAYQLQVGEEVWRVRGPLGEGAAAPFAAGDEVAVQVSAERWIVMGERGVA